MADVKPSLMTFSQVTGKGQTARPAYLSTSTNAAERVLESAQNMIHPVRCEWGAGTKEECGILLGSWTLLQNHLHTVHCRAAGGNFNCKLPKCNCQLQLNRSSLAEHINSAHLLRQTLQCPVPGCKAEPLQGADALIKHSKEHHCNKEGKPHQLPSESQFSTTWKPIPWFDSQANGSTASLGIPSNVSSLALSTNTKLDFGTILVARVSLNPSQTMTKLLRNDLEELLPSQSEMPPSQSQGLMSSQGMHPMSRRKRTKQLEHVKETSEVKEDGIISLVLGDLTRFDADLGRDSKGLIDDGVRNYQAMGRFGGARRKTLRHPPMNGVGKKTEMTKKVDGEVIIGQPTKQFMNDLSRPQPMLDTAEVPKDIRAPRIIGFDVMAKKLDSLRDKGVLEVLPHPTTA